MNLSDNVNIVLVEQKAKRGRKSKKELLASLNLLSPTSIENVVSNNVVNSNIVNSNVIETNAEKTNDEETNAEETNVVIISKPDLIDNTDKPVAKKRGRKPKGGKIVLQPETNSEQINDKPNVILHLKCSLKDLQNNTSNNNGFMESYKKDISYDVICDDCNITNTQLGTYTSINDDENFGDYEPNRDPNKEICKKLKQLEHNLHVNNVNNKKSSCFWDTFEFDNPPIYIPMHFINGTYHVYGCFCSPECGAAYLMKENIDSSVKFERYHLLNHIYSKIYEYKKNIKPAPDPRYMLEKYLGNLSIQEYRSLLRNERLFLIVDKPLTRIMPELHEDNDDFILNNKIIPSNMYQLKTKLQNKKQNKSSILNEKFGITS